VYLYCPFLRTFDAYIVHRIIVSGLVEHRDLTARNWLVLTGAHDLLALEPHRVAHTVGRVFLHPDFNLDTFDSDVALLRLNSPVSWSSTVSPVCLPPPDYEFHATTQCVITGWGVAGRPIDFLLLLLLDGELLSERRPIAVLMPSISVVSFLSVHNAN